jgi:hypothetical protein
MNRTPSIAILMMVCCLLAPTGLGLAVAAQKPPPVGQILKITDPMTRQVIQRRDDNVGTIFVAGTFSGNVDGFQVTSILPQGMYGTPVGWTPLLEVTMDDGYFVGIFRQPAGGFYDLQIRPIFEGQMGAPVIVYSVGVGEVFITAGQSNATNCGTPTFLAPSLLVSCFNDGWLGGTNPNYPEAYWRWGYDPQPTLDCSTNGSTWPTMATNLSNALGVPIGMYAAGYGGTAIENWLPRSVLIPAGPGNPEIILFNRLTNAINYFNGRGGVRAVLWIQGETDFGLDTDPAVYQAYLRDIITESRQVTGVPVKWMVAQTTTPVNYYRLSEKLALEQAQAAVVDNVLTFAGPNVDSIGLAYRLAVDGNPVHFNAAGLELLGGYWGIYVVNTPGFLAAGYLPAN